MCPALFNVYGDKLVGEVIEETSGLVVGRKRLKTIKHTDD